MSRSHHPHAAAETLLRHQPLFRELDARTLGRLSGAAGRRPLKAGEAVFRKGDQPTGMYIVVFGSIRLLGGQGARGERLTGIAKAGSSFGEAVMFLQRPAVVDAVAAEDSLVLHLPKTAILEEIEREPQFALKMLASLSLRIEGLVSELDKQAAGSGRARLAQYLLSLRRAGHEDVVQLPAPKAAVASQLNLTPEHFSRLLHGFAAEGSLDVHGREVRLLAPADLAAAAASGLRKRAAASGTQ